MYCFFRDKIWTARRLKYVQSLIEMHLHRNQQSSEDQLEADMTYQMKEDDTDLESFEREEQRIVAEMEEVNYVLY